jgi:hypothetical protein
LVRIEHCKRPDTNHCYRIAAAENPPHTAWNVKIVFDEFSTCVADYCQGTDNREMDAEPQVGGQNGLQIVGKIMMRFSEIVACGRAV